MPSNKSVYTWSLADRGIVSLINFGVNIALAHLLSTDDFGLLAMVAIFIAIANDLSNCGLMDGIVHKVNPTEEDYSTAFIYNSGVGLLFGLVFFFGAPLFADYFGHQEIAVIMRVLGICFFFETMGYVQETRLRKHLKMRTIALVRISATLVVSTLGIIAACLGYGYIALIITQIFLSVVIFTFYVISSRWFPRLIFSKRSFKELFGYGVHLMLAYMANLVGKNVNMFVLGRIYPTPAQSGVYWQGSKLSAIPFAITESSLNSPFFVVASNEPDSARRVGLIKEMFANIIAVNGTIMLFLVVMAAPIILTLYGAKWEGAIPIFRLLAIAECLVCISSFFKTICKVHARTALVRNLSFAQVILQLGLLAVCCRMGVAWIAATQLTAVAVFTIVYAMLVRKNMEMNLRGMASMVSKVLWLPMLAAALALVGVSMVSSFPPLVGCLTGGGIFACVGLGIGEWKQVPAYIAIRNKLFPRSPTPV